ncbi:unnamed protein product [Schistocephalus solidus]|uniref:Uncharacterized protein n=1 Tax=Schistocephalus solidus TaxID=70667 RepID=A0A183S9A3_SCHSO|nr:unnamed protein product [Schistocephalus solidus]
MPFRSAELDSLLESGQEAESLPSQLLPQTPEAEMARQDPGHGRPEVDGILSIHVMLRQVQLRWSGHLVRMGDERLPKRLFYGDFATGAHRQGGQKRRYRVTLKELQINPVTWEDLTQDIPARRRLVRTGTAI